VRGLWDREWADFIWRGLACRDLDSNSPTRLLFDLGFFATIVSVATSRPVTEKCFFGRPTFRFFDDDDVDEVDDDDERQGGRDGERGGGDGDSFALWPSEIWKKK
jgi:hypothetical protein